MKILINKFKRIEGLDLSIPASIRGGNGLGKSTILEAISFVLTGKNIDGKEFEQVYDNRTDLHYAIADVVFVDNYGNEFQRIVQPIFQTNRAGIEEIKIKRSTECRKNGIPVPDFAGEFAEFYKYGTDYFFNQKEDLQRSIFIDLLKSKLPNFDVNSASLQLKELKRSQKIEVDAVKRLQDAQKTTKDIAIPTIPTDLFEKNEQYLKLISSANPNAAAEINKKNNSAMGAFFESKNKLQNEVSSLNRLIDEKNNQILSEKNRLESLKLKECEPIGVEDAEPFSRVVDSLYDEFINTEHFEFLEVYAAKYFSKNPILVENQNKIQELMASTFQFIETENSGNCPLSNEICETAKLYSEKSAKIKFDAEKNEQIAAIKSENRAILEKEMMEINSKYMAVKFDLQEAQRKLNNVIESNKKIEADNEFFKSSFYDTQKKAIDECEYKIKEFHAEIQKLSYQLTEKLSELSALAEPTPEKLPEAFGISDELKAANEQYQALQVEINKAQGVNENNARLITERAEQIKEKQANLLQIMEQINDLQTAISAYFSNLSEIVKTEFAGDIDIDVDLLEYVISRDEYKDVFKITANGKIFPYECNGALQNNVKMQILFNMQRIQGYTGVTLVDNAEANTSQPINTNGLNCVLAFATFDTELIIR